MAQQLWIPRDDDGGPWPVISSGILDAGTPHDRVRLFNRGSLAGEVVLVSGDGAELLARLGLEVSP